MTCPETFGHTQCELPAGHTDDHRVNDPRAQVYVGWPQTECGHEKNGDRCNKPRGHNGHHQRDNGISTLTWAQQTAADILAEMIDAAELRTLGRVKKLEGRVEELGECFASALELVEKVARQAEALEQRATKHGMALERTQTMVDKQEGIIDRLTQCVEKMAVQLLREAVERTTEEHATGIPCLAQALMPPNHRQVYVACSRDAGHPGEHRGEFSW